MKRVLLSSSVSLTLIFAAQSASAADMPVNAPVYKAPYFISDIVRSNNQISVDFAATHVDYLERLSSGAPFNSEKGWVPGVAVTGSTMGDYLGVHNLYLSSRFKWLKGHTDYWAASGPVTRNVDGAELRDWDVRVGKGFDLNQYTMLTPYFGAGTHLWSRDLRGPSGYHEDYRHAYAGGGLLLQFNPVSRLVLSANGLIGHTFRSEMEASQNGGFPIPPWTFKLGNSAIYRAGLSADYAITHHLHGNVGVEFEHFRYGQSASNPFGYLEPSSRTSYVTVTAGVGYSFAP